MGHRNVSSGTLMVIKISSLRVFEILICVLYYEGMILKDILIIPVDFRIFNNELWEMLSKDLLRSKKMPNVLLFSLKFALMFIGSCANASFVLSLSLNP